MKTGILPLACLALVSGAAAQIMPDFQRTDVNPQSPRYNTQISPRHYRQCISAYYFANPT